MYIYCKTMLHGHFSLGGVCQIVEVVKDYNSPVLRYGPIPGLRSRPAGFTCTLAMSDS